MLRFVGNGLHPSDYTRVDAWVKRIAEWVNLGLTTVYFFTHEPDNLLSPELAEYVTAQFQQTLPDAQLRGPVEIKSPGLQGTLF